MWNLVGGIDSDGSNAEIASTVNVLLVDHDGPHETANLLHLCHYQVTFVDLAATAISILTSGEVKFDAVIANIHSPDQNGFELLQLAVNLCLPIIVMSHTDDALVAMRALQIGALLFVKKPASVEVLGSLWQHIFRENVRFAKARESFQETERKAKGRKECTDWTPELHAKFMHAVRVLGQGRCFPKEILNLMNVEGLTRLQVASHLQKCRNDNWRVQAKRTRRSQEEDRSLDSPRNFGAMPQLGRDEFRALLEGTRLDGQNAGTENIMSHTDVHGNREIAPASDGYYVVSADDQQHGSLLPEDPGTLSPSDDFYNLLDMNGCNQNFSGTYQASKFGK